MKLKTSQTSGGFSLVDAVFAMGIAGVLFGSLYGGLSFGFNTIKFARENTRATQIMVEKMETIRLYTWDQINSNGFIPTNKFVVPYYSVGGSSNASSLMYTGQVFIGDSGLGTSYAGDVKRITVRINWLTGKTPRSRAMSTYMSRSGLYKYVY